jgi:hypothetical protein
LSIQTTIQSKSQSKTQLQFQSFIQFQIQSYQNLNNPNPAEIPEINNQIHSFIIKCHLLSSLSRLLCRIVVVLPFLPVILFCRFCFFILRLTTRILTGLITRVMETGTIPIRMISWAWRWITGANAEHDYYASGAPEVSFAGSAAMSGPRLSRPPAILCEDNTCKCNACLWRRAHEAKLPPGKLCAPIQRRPTQVGPGRMRRFRCFCACLPDLTFLQSTRIRLDRLRRSVAEAYVEFVLDYQHAVCNTTLVTTGVSLGLLALQVLGYFVPGPLVAAVYLSTFLTFWSFGTLLIALKPRPQVLAPISMDQLADALPQTSEVRGLAPKQQLDDNITKTLNHHQLSDGSAKNVTFLPLFTEQNPNQSFGTYPPLQPTKLSGNLQTRTLSQKGAALTAVHVAVVAGPHVVVRFTATTAKSTLTQSRSVTIEPGA